MNLKSGNNLENNLKLLRNVSKIKIMEIMLRQRQYYNSQTKKGYNRAQELDVTLDELEELNSILSSKHLNISELENFFNDQDNSKDFQKFSEYVQSVPSIIVSYQFKHRATALANSNNLKIEKLQENLGKAFNLNKIELSLQKDFKHRAFKGVLGTSLAALGTAAAIYGATNLVGQQTSEDKSNPVAIESTITTDDAVTYTPAVNHSESNISSYAEACRDYYNKTAQAYEYATGESIDLSQYTQKNLEITSGYELIATYNGKTYHFTSKPYMQKALEAAGATVEMKENTFYSIYDEEKDESIAIIDKYGQPVVSGNVLEKANGHGQMYKQKYVNESKKNLKAQGYDVSQMTEAELVGRYLLNEENHKFQLSQAMAETKTLFENIKNTFYYSNNNSSTNKYGESLLAIEQYSQSSKKLEEDYPEIYSIEDKTQTSDYSQSNDDYDFDR